MVYKIMDLSIIILNYNNKNLAKELLKNLTEELSLPYNFEIIVVDNASYDGLDDIIKEKFPQVKFIQSDKNGGFAYGNNLGIKEAKGKYIIIMNPDLAILSNALEVMYQYMEDHPEVGLAGPRLINADKSIQYSCTRFPDWRLPFYRRTLLSETKAGQKWLDNYLMKDINHYQNIYVPTVFGACMIFRRDVLSKVGLLDDRYFMYMEDLDWSRRFWENGYKVAYIGRAEIIHLHRRQSAAESLLKVLRSKTARHHILSFIKYLAKFKGKKLPPTV
ncbi:glycosyltransferase family 2 protein [Candidatus Parcubacteria bacterium]|nr:MAG: glycosyltransferase family 2 protein [Candidatus Parcubacteria bacterium]